MAETASLSRAAAHDILLDVLGEGVPFDDAFDRATRALGPRDRAFVRLLVATTFRHMGRLDAVLKLYLDKPVPKRAAGARHLMRLGAAQLLFLGTPAHAAVATAVEAARMRGLQGYAGLINAVLRKVSAEGTRQMRAMNDPLLDYPKWLTTAWTEAWGEKTATLIARASAREARLDLTPADGNAAALAEKLGGTVVTPWGSVRMPAGPHDVPRLPGFREGEWWVQDAAAALPVHLMGDLKGLRVLDLCAAPGGKTLQLAAAGARVTAVDRSDARLARLRDNLKRTRLGGDVRVICADAARWRPPASDGPFDCVLVDAPCSATGTLRRNPDLAWIKGAGTPADLNPIQDALIDSAVELLKPGGTLVYSVCSLQDEEGEPRVEAALARHKGLRRKAIDPSALLPDTPVLTPAGDIRLFPFHLGEAGGMDGFFVALLTRD
ncbi:RsmB/NOP family class I SAM-dependent RNA methyltransferase [Phaeovibrio sulfidiphilus]|uniref:RsmB/NOP family class I SAM-dependent RNA methyltransferase n=1 Tax=Phaeovibrio sulfidiphilus TaxID=1220600 RepID=A0A8J6YN35_9PROT|nr:RsmB/NOP family class I SAM-dependent RNA methyltransferase [Phaeovibrio sulfidiphilus]MBE1236924.1 RsmB/NOP family class I SAM-dependent RNA methyltransferase [Phaeovibrio sulfidiphilus]